jgi:hypothetical protein
MPWLQEYQCKEGHRFERLHGSRAEVRRYRPCDICVAESVDTSPIAAVWDVVNRLYEEVQTIESPTPVLAPLSFNLDELPEGVACTMISAVAGVTVVKGNGDFNERQRERLEARSAEHWKKKGRDAAVAAEERVWRQYRKTAEGG